MYHYQFYKNQYDLQLEQSTLEHRMRRWDLEGRKKYQGGGDVTTSLANIKHSSTTYTSVQN
jgi:hypothetical protein